MKKYSSINGVHYRLVLWAGALLFVVNFPPEVNAQKATQESKSTTNQDSGKSTSDNKTLLVQMRELQDKVAKLEAALKKKNMGMMAPGKMGMKKGMKMMSGKKMGMMKNKKGMMASKGKMGGKEMGMGKGKMGGRGMTKGKRMMGSQGNSGMAMMGQMKGMNKMSVSSSLPGFAGASHIYHIGATSFFLDHEDHITLTTEQQKKLNAIKEKALLGQATSDRWISEGEQELWVLTSSDLPQASKIEAKIREVEKMKSDKRIAYIRAVGKAAKILTEEQRQALVGSLPPEHTATEENDQK